MRLTTGILFIGAIPSRSAGEARGKALAVRDAMTRVNTEVVL